MAIQGTDSGGAKISNLSTMGMRIACTTLANATISAAGAPATLSFATVDGGYFSPGKLEAGYVSATAGGYIQITDYAGTGVYWKVPITTAGVQSFDLRDMQLPRSTGMVVSIGAGTGANLAYLNVRPFIEK